MGTILETEKTVKILKLNKSIGDNLKLPYDYHCHICGARIGGQYNSNVVEAHHINYFVKSFINGSKNHLLCAPIITVLFMM